jgi:hypothetical protein
MGAPKTPQQAMRRAWQAEKNTDPEVAEMVLYHGTTDKFDAFDPQKFGGQSSISESGGKGVWLTSSPKVADFYGDMSAVTKSNRQFPNWDDRSQAMAARQEISKGKQVMPLTVRGRLKEIDMAGAKYSQDMSLSKLADDARAEGFDGVRFRNFVDGPEVADHVLIFDPSNIRSVNAAFDPDNAASPILTAGLGGGGRKPPPDSPEAITEAVRGIARQTPPTPPGGPVIPPRGNMRGVLQAPERIPPASPMAGQVPPPLPPRPVSNRAPTSNMPTTTEMGLMAGTGMAVGGAFLMEKANDPATFGLASFDELPPDHPLRDPQYRQMALMAQMKQPPKAPPPIMPGGVLPPR